MKKTLEELNMLLVDDEPDILELLANQFRVFGIQAQTANSGKMAIELIRQESFDVVITDARMKNGDGLWLLKEIRSIDHTKPSVFFLTGIPDIKFEEIFHEGADGLFHKPFSSRALIEAARHAVNPKNVQWNVPPAYEPKFNLTGEFASIEPREAIHQLVLGRGGFKVPVEDSGKYELNKPIQCSFTFKEGPIKQLECIGKVLWIVADSSKKSSGHIGVEFAHVDGNCRQNLIEYIEKQDLKPYIPKP
jgi:CheY-like chemotaxis protein